MSNDQTMAQDGKTGFYPAAQENPFVFREEPSEKPAGRKYDLAERTAKFADDIIQFCRTVPLDPITRPSVTQLTRSGTSIGANYCEADDAVSKKEFRLKIGTCRKEAKETKYWIRIIATAIPSLRDQARPLWLEAKELHLIFCAILKK